MKQRILVVVALMVTVVVATARTAAAAPTGWYAIHGRMPGDPLGQASHDHPAVVALADGRVLVIGGEDSSGEPLASVDVYNPATRSWSAGAWLTIARSQSAAVLLPDGRVLVAGGMSRRRMSPRGEIFGSPSIGALAPTASVDIYDPSTDTWQEADPLPEPRATAAAVTLADGRVLIAGGRNRDDRRTTFLYDASIDRWTLGPELRGPRSSGTLTRFDDGRVLLSGGTLNDLGVAAAEIFDPVTNLWRPAGAMSTGRRRATTGRLADGRVIVAGGDTPGLTRAADIYDPATGQWHVTGPMTTAHIDGAGGTIGDGTFLVAGGALPRGDLRAVDAYDPSTDTWTAADSMILARAAAGASVSDGNLVVAGGGSATGEVYVLNRAPVAAATVQASAFGVPASGIPGEAAPRAAVTVSGDGSSDPDGDALTYTWSENGTTLAVTSDPRRTTVVGLTIGVHALTLTVSDGFGGVSTAAATTVVMDGTAAYQDQIRDLVNQIQVLKAEVGAPILAITQDFRMKLNDPAFVVPGATSEEQLAAIVRAILTLPLSAKMTLHEILRVQ